MNPELMMMMQMMGSDDPSQRGSMFQQAINPATSPFTPQPLRPIQNPNPSSALGLNQGGALGMMLGMPLDIYYAKSLGQRGGVIQGTGVSFAESLRNRRMFQESVALNQAMWDSDSEGLFETVRGFAALTGSPFGPQQQQETRDMLQTLQAGSPFLSLLAPEFMDAIAGPAGSGMKLSSQISNANRYRIDPITGQMGYGAEINQNLARGLYDDLLTGPNLSNMQGIRAGDIGELYSRLASKGQLGDGLSYQERVRQTALDMVQGGEISLENLEKESGVDLSAGIDNLAGLDLQKVAKSDSVSKRISSDLKDKTKNVVESYVETLSAMRELMGENGDPNAPIPKLMNALEAFTRNGTQSISRARMTDMVRDIQAVTQITGHTLEQVFQTQQFAEGQAQALNLGATSSTQAALLGTSFASVYDQTRGSAPVSGALDKDQLIQAVTSLALRGNASEMSKTMVAVAMLAEGAGGYTNTVEGRTLQAISEAYARGDSQYVDPLTNTKKDIPRKMSDVVPLVSAGAIEGINETTFRQTAMNETRQKAFLDENQEFAVNAFLSGQGTEIRNNIRDRLDTQITGDFNDDTARGRILDTVISAMDEADIGQVSAASYYIEKLQTELGLSKPEAIKVAQDFLNAAESATRNKIGQDGNLVSFDQIFGKQAREALEETRETLKSRSDINKMLSPLNQTGSLMQRIFQAIQKQGVRGEEADLKTLTDSILGAEPSLVQEILPEANQQLIDLTADYEDLHIQSQRNPDDPDIQRRLTTTRDKITALVAEIKTITDISGVDSTYRKFGDDARSEALDSYQRVDKATTEYDKLSPEEKAKTDSTTRARLAGDINRQFKSLGEINDRVLNDPLAFREVGEDTLKKHADMFSQISNSADQQFDGDVAEMLFSDDPDVRQAYQEFMDLSRKIINTGKYEDIAQKFSMSEEDLKYYLTYKGLADSQEMQSNWKDTWESKTDDPSNVDKYINKLDPYIEASEQQRKEVKRIHDAPGRVLAEEVLGEDILREIDSLNNDGFAITDDSYRKLWEFSNRVKAKDSDGLSGLTTTIDEIRAGDEKLDLLAKRLGVDKVALLDQAEQIHSIFFNPRDAGETETEKEGGVTGATVSPKVAPLTDRDTTSTGVSSPLPQTMEITGRLDVNIDNVGTLAGVVT